MEKFYESYKRTRDMAGTLEYVFWNTLPENVKGSWSMELDVNNNLLGIFNYCLKVIEREYKQQS